ncbi:hypothetical protein NMG60_11021161 [Bertholletia excelsa]
MKDKFFPSGSARLFAVLLFTFLVIFPTLVLGDCTCEGEEEDHVDKKSVTIKYKVAAIFSILTAGSIGVLFPILGKGVPALRPEKDIFFIIKAFAAGVILSTGFIHILPDAFERLSSPKLKGKAWEYPFTGFIAMVAAIVTLMIDAFATSYFQKSHFGDKAGQVVNDDEERSGEHVNHMHVHTHATHGHSHGSAPSDDSSKEDLLRHRVISQVLELGIVAHSVIMGISLGASESLKTIRPLVGAVTFHQFFEGMGLGGCITQARFGFSHAAIMALFFSLTTPVGIAVGIVISSRYNEDSTTALIVEGILNAAAAGILIYMSLVDLLATDFMSPRLQSNFKLQLGANAALLLGAGCMAILAKWA